MRAFIAIDLDPALKAAVRGLVRGLEAVRAEVRWAKPDGHHLTLKFLGEIGEEAVGRVRAALKEAAARHRPFPLRLVGTGAFPGERSPRVLWVGVEAGPELSALQADLEAALEKEGFPAEGRAFKAHLTLGRVKGRGGIDKVMAMLAARGREDFGGMTVGKLALFESRLRPDGAEYRIVGEAALV